MAQEEWSAATRRQTAYPLSTNVDAKLVHRPLDVRALERGRRCGGEPAQRGGGIRSASNLDTGN